MWADRGGWRGDHRASSLQSRLAAGTRGGGIEKGSRAEKLIARPPPCRPAAKWADDVVEIADNARNDYMDRLAKNGEIERVPDPELVQRSKLRIDTRKFLMAKLAPKTYGDKVDVNLSGTVEVSTLSDEELESRTRARLVALGVDVAAPLLLPMPGAAPAPVAALAPAITLPGSVEDGPAPGAPGSTGKRSANDLLGLGPAA